MFGKRNYLSVLLASLFLIILFPQISSAQWGWQNRVNVSGDGLFMGGVGLAFIGGDTYYAVNLRTEMAFGQFGLGIDLPLHFNTDNGELRHEDWDTTYDYFRIIRYLRYGRKRRTPVYARLGTLDGARLGHGFIMNYYTNEANYDARKIGTEFDLKFDRWGLETVVSNYDRVEILGGRAYVLPLKGFNNLLLFNRLTFGATFVTDRDPDETSATDDAVTIYGLDVELPLLYSGPFFSSIYADYAKIHNYGSGVAIGIEAGLWKLGGLISLQAKLERRFLGKEFLPTYFNPFYEVEKARVVNSITVTKQNLLLQRISREQGYYGELFGDVIKIVKLLGTFERIDGAPNSGRLHLAALLSNAIPRISARGIYDKNGVEDFWDAFTVNDRSILRAGVGYQINPYLYFFTDYVWTFHTNEQTGELESQRRVEPQISFVMPLNFGGR